MTQRHKYNHKLEALKMFGYSILIAGAFAGMYAGFTHYWQQLP